MTTQPTEGRYYDFGIKDRIRAAREGAGMDQGQLADATGLSRQTISNYERGQTTRFSKGSVRLIAWATGFDFDWLLSGEVPPTSGHDRTCVQGSRPSQLHLVAA